MKYFSFYPNIINILIKIFELFYRCGNELTRTTPGTGIGLALVKQLVLAQEASITLVPQETGVAFALDFNARY